MTADLHVITLRKEGWSLAHPPSCDDDHCLTHRAVFEQLRAPPPLLGRHPVHLEEDGRLVIEERNVWSADDRPDPALLPPPMTTRINRLGHHPVDKAVIRDSFSPWGS